jgi:hypothetical protein
MIGAAMMESSSLILDTICCVSLVLQWILSVPFALRFLFAREPLVMSKVLGIVSRAISTYLIKKVGLSKKTARTSAVTLSSLFGSALNLNIHFHMVFLNGVYVDAGAGESDQHFIAIHSHRVADIVRLTHNTVHE